MRELRSYVVRIYREAAGAIAGTVQDVRSGRTLPFQTIDELWTALHRTASPSARRTPMTSRRTTASAQADPSGRQTSQDEEEES